MWRQLFKINTVERAILSIPSSLSFSIIDKASNAEEEIGADIRKTVAKMKKRTNTTEPSSVHNGSFLSGNDGTVRSTDGTTGAKKSAYDISKSILAPEDSSFFKEMEAPPSAKSLSGSGRTLSASSSFTLSTVGSSLFEMGNRQRTMEDSINEEGSEESGDDANKNADSPFTHNFWRHISNLFCEKVACSPDGIDDSFLKTTLQTTKEKEFDDGYLSSLRRRVTKMNQTKLSHNPIYHGPTEDEADDVESLDDSLLKEDGGENFFASLWSNTWANNDETVTLDTVPSALTGASSITDSTSVSSESKK